MYNSCNAFCEELRANSFYYSVQSCRIHYINLVVILYMYPKKEKSLTHFSIILHIFYDCLLFCK